MSVKPLAILLVICLPCTAQKLTIQGKGLTMTDVFRAILQQTDYQVIYSEQELSGAPLFDLHYRHADVREVLDDCFTGLQLTYSIFGSGKICVFLKVKPELGLYIPLEGRVQSAQGEPLEGASISVDGVPQQRSGPGGVFRLPVKALRTAVTISYLGYSPQTLILGNTLFQVVTLQPVASLLDQTVVQAYGKTTTRLATGSIVQIEGATLMSQPAGNVLAALEGRVPGMTIKENNGVPGSGFSTLVRGRQSISQGTDPLIVVDGVPIAFNDGLLATIGTGSAQGPGGASDLNGIPVSAISSIEVLKGAAATAIYGSRGSNGVILLTLKTGATGRLKWDANVSSGMDQVVKTSPFLTTRQYLDLRENAVTNDGFQVNINSIPELYLWDSTRYTDFKKMTTGNSRWRTNAEVGLSGGHSHTVFLVSGNYQEEKSAFPGASSDETISVYGHLHQQTANKRLQLNLSALCSWENNRLPIADFTYFGTLAPNAPPFSDSAGQPRWAYNGISYLNIPALENNSYQGKVSKQFNHLEVGYRVLPALTLKVNLGYYHIGSAEYSQQPIAGQSPVFDPTNPSYYNTANHSHSEMVEGLTEYTQAIGRDRLDVMAGLNWQDQHTAYSAVNAFDLYLPAVVTSQDSSLYYRYAAVFGRIDYKVRNRYLLTLTGRRDGSSRFGPSNLFGNFWSAGAAWIFSEESFFRPWRWLSFGKLRGSVGQTGNDQIANNYEQVYSSNTTRGYQGIQGILPTTFNNTDQHWEVNCNSEVELDLGFLQNKVLLSATGYRDWTTNQLLYISLPSQSGLPGVETNVPANVTNTGIELSLQTYNWTSKNFRWISTLTFTAPVNRLRRFPDLDNSAFAGSLVVGQSLSVVQGYHYTGVDPATGLFQFRHFDPDSNLDSRDIIPHGNFDVHYYGGCQQSLRYKGWQLDLFIELRVQSGFNPFVTIYQESAPGFAGPSMLSNVPSEWLHRWQRNGDRAALQQVTENYASPAFTAMMNYISSDAEVANASFIRLKSVMLSYQLPKSWLKWLKMQEGRLYVQGQNLWTWTHFPVTDPETQDPTVLPPVRTLVSGVKVAF